jgi:hypothetical protein
LIASKIFREGLFEDPAQFSTSVGLRLLPGVEKEAELGGAVLPLRFWFGLSLLSGQ